MEIKCENTQMLNVHVPGFSVYCIPNKFSKGSYFS